MTDPRLTPLAASLPATVPFTGPEALERPMGVRLSGRMGTSESGSCQTKANRFQFPQRRRTSCSAKHPPLGQSGGAVRRLGVSAGKAPFGVEVIVHGPLDSDEFLQAVHAPKAQHGPLSPSDRQV